MLCKESQSLPGTSGSGATEIRKIVVQSQCQANGSQDPTSKILNTKTAGRVVQVVEIACLASTRQSSNPSTAKKESPNPWYQIKYWSHPEWFFCFVLKKIELLIKERERERKPIPAGHC
jgi:hypothetical protein